MEFGFNTGGEHQSILGRLTLRPYRPGDEERIVSTFNSVFGVQRKLAEWHWAYRQNPVGTRIHLAVAPDGTIAGHWAGLPVAVHTSFGRRVFVQIVDTFVHPDFRKGGHDGPGVFAMMGATGIERWMAECGDAALYGYPVPLAEKMGQRFLGYRRLRVVDYLCRPIGVAAAGAGLLGATASGDLVLERVTELPSGSRQAAQVDALFLDFAATERCLVVRDQTYLRWRYLECPGNPYEMYAARRGDRWVGWMMLRPEHDTISPVCTIADWMVPSREAAVVDALLAVAEARGRDGGRANLLAVFAEPAPEYADFRARGFELVPSSRYLERRLTYWTGPAFPELTHEFLAATWWYTLGDSDLV